MKNNILIIIVSTFCSCSYIIDLKKDSDIVVEQIIYDKINSTVEILAPCRIILTNDPEEVITIKGKDYIVKNYQIINKENITIIDHYNLNHLQEKKIADIYIPTANLKTLTFNSAAKLCSIDTIKSDNLEFYFNRNAIYCTSDITINANNLIFSIVGGTNQSSHTIAGKVNSAYFCLEGGSYINAENLSTNKAKITHKSYGYLYITVEDSLTVETYNKGDVLYKGNPFINHKQIKNPIMNASGKVIDINND